MNILGIESSCDETAAAVVTDGKAVRSSIVASQIDLHARYGGVVPEIASRAHLEKIVPVIAEAMSAAGVTADQIDAIAVANRPGLVGSLLIGVTAAKAVAWSWGKPLVAVNHIHSHAYSAMIARPEPPGELLPAVALVVSGGHTSLYLLGESEKVSGPFCAKHPPGRSGKRVLTPFPILLGRCIDDAAGEAFDKVAAILKLGYPGGPIIDRLAREGNPKAFNLPRTWLKAKGATGREGNPPEASLDFSFSGLKTAVLYQVHGQDMLAPSQVETMDRRAKADLAASFQAAVVEVLVGKTLLAADRAGVRRVFVGGGVGCNSALRATLAEAASQRGIEAIFTPPALCTDNAAIHAALGYYRLLAGQTAGLDLPVSAG